MYVPRLIWTLEWRTEKKTAKDSRDLSVSRARDLILLKTYFHPDDAPDVMPLPEDPLILGEQRQ